MPEFEFDSKKSRLNKQRHGVDFEWAKGLWEVAHVAIPAKNVIGENRVLLLARIAGKCFAVIYTMRGERVRRISCHRADWRLEKIYENRVEKE